MNVLPLVITLLLVFSLMTYGKLQVFLSQSLLNKQMECYLKASEIALINKVQEDLYEKHHSSSKEPLDSQQAPIKSGIPQEKAGGSRSINWNVFIDRTLREQDQSRFRQILTFSKRLIFNLYGQQPFYRTLQEKRGGDIGEELLSTIMKVTESTNPSFENLSKPIDLTRIDLKDEELQKLMIKIFRGREDTALLKACEQRNNNSRKTKKFMGYPKISDFVSFHFKSKKSQFEPLRLWLAPEEVLLAVFDDPFFVQTLIEERKTLHNQLSKFHEDGLKSVKSDFKNRFEGLFEGKISPELRPLVNFEVSTTRPPTASSSSELPF